MLEYYDRRLAVYTEVRKILDLIMRDGEVSDEALQKFYSATSQADFLFEKEIPEYINEIFDHGIDLQRWSRVCKKLTQKIYKDPSSDEEYNSDEAFRNQQKELIWFSKQFDPAKEKFKKYLHMR